MFFGLTKVVFCALLVLNPIIGQRYCCTHEHFLTLEISESHDCSAQLHCSECECSSRPVNDCRTLAHSDFLSTSVCGLEWFLLALVCVFLHYGFVYDSFNVVRTHFLSFFAEILQIQAPVRLHLLKNVFLN